MIPEPHGQEGRWKRSGLVFLVFMRMSQGICCTFYCSCLPLLRLHAKRASGAPFPMSWRFWPDSFFTAQCCVGSLGPADSICHCSCSFPRLPVWSSPGWGKDGSSVEGCCFCG